MTDRWLSFLGTFYKQQKIQLYNYALSIVHQPDEAEDVVHTSLEKLLKFSASHKVTSGDLRILSIRFIKTTALDVLRKRKVRNEVNFDLTTILDERSLSSEHLLVAEHFSCLTENEKEVIILKEVMGYKYREIAQIMDESPSTVSSRYRRGISKMRTRIQEAKDHE